MKLRSRNHMEAYLLDKYPPYQGGSAIKSGVRLPGTAGNYISSPDSVLNSVTGDIDIRWYGKLDWTSGSTQTLLAKLSTGSTRSFWIDVTSNVPSWRWSNDGSATNSSVASTSMGFVAQAAQWLRVTFKVDNGAGGNDTKFYTSTDGITWTQLGTTITVAGVAQMFDSTSPIELGSRALGTVNILAGTIYYAEVRNGIDGPVVAKFDSSQAQVSGSQTPATINGWTWNGSALYKRDDYVRLPGTSGNYLSFPDTVDNSVTGDIDIRAKIAPDDWTPAALMQVLNKEIPTTQRSYGLRLDTTGKLMIRYCLDGTTALQLLSTVATGYTDGTAHWVRVTRTSADTTIFYTSEDGVTWTQLGTTVGGANPGALFDSTSPIEIGARSITNDMFTGNVYYAEVRNGIGGPVVASFNGADNKDQTPWTVNGSGWNWEGASFSGKPGVALSLPGTANQYGSTPDTTSNSILGDIDMRAKLSAKWTGAVANQSVVSKYNSTGNQRSYWFFIDTTGHLVMQWSADGTATIVKTSSAIGLSDDVIKWVRTTLDVDNGAAGNDVRFFLSDDGVTWTPLGTVITAAGITAIFDSTTEVEIGAAFGGGSNNLIGKIYYAEVRNGIDGPIVAKFDASNIAKTGTRTPTSTVQPGGTPNMLTPQQASFETDASGWQDNVANTTLAQNATQFLDGTKSLSMAAIGIGVTGVRMADITGVVPVVPGKQYFAKANFRAATTGRAVRLAINWYQASNAFISNAQIANGADITTGWTELSGLTVVAPALAAKAALVLTINDAAQPLGEVHYVDRISLVEAAEVWTLNGSAWDWVQSAA